MPKPDENTRIHLLDDETVNKIAAGEVVERPASVVKELIENAIDAQAEHIRIEIRTGKGGITEIHVIDDGSGMVREDAILAFTRHATSKIKNANDLIGVRTMGFRGEALASITAVARVTLVTKQKEAEMQAATRIINDGGEIIEVGETGAPAGTSVIVRDFFYNTPARKKFLKSLSTELGHIYRTVEQIALAHREIAFSLILNGREKMNTYPSGSLRDTIAALYGVNLAKSLLLVKGRTPFMRIEGYIAKPAVQKPNAYQISISINERQITSIPLSRAIKKGYGTLLPKNRYPVAFLNLNLDTALVDVNVHPAKKEVRLSRLNEISQEITSCIAQALQAQNLLTEPEAAVDSAYHIKGNLSDISHAMQVESPTTPYRSRSKNLTLSDSRLRVTESRGEEKVHHQNPLPPMKAIGQVASTYILAKTTQEGDEEDLLVIDQHAAHERVLYEQISAQRDLHLESQELLVPIIMNLNPKEAAAVRNSLHLLMREGFVLEEFGTDAFAVRTTPIVLGKSPERELLQDIISDLVAGEEKSTDLFREKVTAILACKGAIKAGDELTMHQMNRLILQLGHTKTPFTCPHGRPTIILFSHSRLNAMFKRT